MFNFNNLNNSESEPSNHSQLNLNFYAEGITSLIPPLFTVEEFDFPLIPPQLPLNRHQEDENNALRTLSSMLSNDLNQVILSVPQVPNESEVSVVKLFNDEKPKIKEEEEIPYCLRIRNFRFIDDVRDFFWLNNMNF